mgnify:CR=1 FL=1
MQFLCLNNNPYQEYIQLRLFVPLFLGIFLLAHTCLQTSEYWGGGQRCTLEALACDVPVICMTDSPKNREYVEESGCGLVVEPNAQNISDAVHIVKATDYGTRGSDYVKSKWTSKHYADNLLEWINQQ